MDNTFINQHNLSQSIFNAGNAGVIQNLAGRVPNVNSLLSGNASLAGALNTINTIPGVGPALSNLENNPLGALTNFGGLNLQGGLPSLAGNGSGAGSPGLINGNTNPLAEAFSLASSVGGSSIPSSITGAVELALQIKTVICNLKIPNITVPDIGKLLKANFTAAEKQIKQLILHEAQVLVDELFEPIKKLYDQLTAFFDPEHIKKLLASIIPDVNELINNTVKQFTTCNNGPGAKKNDLSGKSPTGTASDTVTDKPVQEPPTSSQTALDSAAASQIASAQPANTQNANSFLNNAPATSNGPTFSNATETNYDAKGNVIPPNTPNNPTPPPGTTAVTPNMVSPPAPLASRPGPLGVTWSAGSQAQIDALNSGKLK